MGRFRKNKINKLIKTQNRIVQPKLLRMIIRFNDRLYFVNGRAKLCSIEVHRMNFLGNRDREVKFQPNLTLVNSSHCRGELKVVSTLEEMIHIHFEGEDGIFDLKMDPNEFFRDKYYEFLHDFEWEEYWEEYQGDWHER